MNDYNDAALELSRSGDVADVERILSALRRAHAAGVRDAIAQLRMPEGDYRRHFLERYAEEIERT